MNKSKFDDLITRPAAARLRGTTREAIYDLIERGRLETTEVGGHIFVSRRAVLNFKPQLGRRPSAPVKNVKKQTSKRKSKAKR